MTRPTLLQGLLDSWQLSVSQHRRRDLIPYWITGSLVIGGLVAYRLPVTLWDTEIELGVVFMGAVLTFNGIVLALSWSAFAKIYEIVGAGAFCAHLRKHQLLNHYARAAVRLLRLFAAVRHPHPPLLDRTNAPIRQPFVHPRRPQGGAG